VLSLTGSRIVLRVGLAGVYSVDVRYSPYWRPSAGCLSKRQDGLARLTVPRPGVIVLRFQVDAGRAFSALTGDHARTCAR
jgi:hypothetical protein